MSRFGECNFSFLKTHKCNIIKHRHAKRARVIFLVIGSRSIRRTVHSNDLVKFFGGCDVQQEGNWKSIICKYNVTCTSVMVR